MWIERVYARRMRALRRGTAVRVSGSGDTGVLVLCGPAGSGKSSVIALLRLLARLPQAGNGLESQAARAWLTGTPAEKSLLRTTLATGTGDGTVVHELGLLAGEHGSIRIEHEAIGEYAGRPEDHDAAGVTDVTEEGGRRSVLASRRNTPRDPTASRITEVYEDTRVYEGWTCGPDALERRGAGALHANDELDSNAANLMNVLARFGADETAKRITAFVRTADPGIRSLATRLVNGTAVTRVTRHNGQEHDAEWLGDQALQALRVAVALNPPAGRGLVAIDEPERGLADNPDRIPLYLAAARGRRRILLTTASEETARRFEAAGATIEHLAAPPVGPPSGGDEGSG